MIKNVLELLAIHTAVRVTRRRELTEELPDEEQSEDGAETTTVTEPDIVREKYEPRDIPALFPMQGGTLSIVATFANSWATQEVERAVREDIPSNVSGKFMPGDFTVTFGPHEIYADSEDSDEEACLGTAFISFVFWGYGSPRNCREFPELFFNLPSIQDLKRRLETVTGPLEEAFACPG